MAIKIDDLDKLILAELESNSRKSFRDIAGKANEIVAAKAEAVYFVVSGIPMKIKG